MNKSNPSGYCSLPQVPLPRKFEIVVASQDLVPQHVWDQIWESLDPSLPAGVPPSPDGSMSRVGGLSLEWAMIHAPSLKRALTALDYRVQVLVHSEDPGF